MKRLSIELPIRRPGDVDGGSVFGRGCKGLATTVLLVLLGTACARQSEPHVVEMRYRSSVPGFVFTSVELPEGRMQVNLPGDIVAGDTLSGRLYVSSEHGEAIGQAGPGKVMSDFTLEVGTASFPLLDESVVVVVTAPSVDGLPLVLLGADGTLRARGHLPVAGHPPDDVASPGHRIAPPYIPAGGLLRLVGQFDGDLRNTTVEIEGSEVPVEVESPRQIYGVVRRLSPGPAELRIADAGWERRETLNVLSTTYRIASRREDEISIEAIVDGFEGMPSHLRPVLEFGIWHDGEQLQERSLELDPGRAIEGRIVVREALVLPDEHMYSVHIRHAWESE